MNYDQYIDIFAPVGVVLPFATNNLPNTFLECDGTSLLVADYNNLFSLIQYTYGGSGLNFSLPDYQNYFVRGFDDTGVADPNYNTRSNRGDGVGGAVIGSKQTDEYQAHRHSYYYTFSAGGGTGYTPSKMIRISGWGSSPTSRTLSGQGGGSETRPDSVRVVYAIRVL